MRTTVTATAALIAVLAACTPRVAMQQPVAPAAASDSGVRAAAAEFVAAFNALDQARFDALWAEDATVFFPQHPFPIRRVTGKAEVTAWFKRFFDSQRSDGKTPGIDPRDLYVQMIGADSALISFHLGSDPKGVARRTLAWRQVGKDWRVVHLHASSLTIPKP